ncbi:MAG: helix-turn-helix domain-containing protein [Hyphomicrobiaceae bacterium]
MRTRQDNLLEDRVDDLARRLRAIEEWFGEADRRDADAQAAEQQAKPYMSTREAAEYLNLSTAILEQWRSYRPGGPPYRKVGRRVVYAAADLDKFLEERCRSRPLLGRPS